MTQTKVDNRHLGDVYDFPELYDIAFSYRDICLEVDCLYDWYRRHTGTKSLRSTLELGCGPASHSIEFARRRCRATALDRSASMCRYAAKMAREARVDIDVVQADMRAFTLPRRVDMVISMLDSVSHLTTKSDIRQMFESVRSVLKPHGVAILEMAHPSEFEDGNKRTTNEWVSKRDGIQVMTRWGGEGDDFDPDTLTGCANVSMEVLAADGSSEVHDFNVPFRRWTDVQIIEAARGASLECVAIYGAWATDIPFSVKESSWRMIPVFQHAGTRRTHG